MTVRTQKTKRGAERAEEPVEPVKATTTPPADHAATDALLDAIEATLDETTVEEQKPDTLASRSLAMGIDLAFTEPSWMVERFFTTEPEPQPEDDIPWDEIANMPPPGPGGRYLQYRVPEEIDWTELRGDASVVVVPPDCIREVLVTRAMWEEARRGMRGRPQRFHGDDGMCRRCGWPKAGPGGPQCQGPLPDRMGLPVMDPRSVARITNVC